MFDKEFDQRSYTNIHVEQQPNDAADDARLYGQIKDKVEKEWIEALDLPDNFLGGKVFTAYDVGTMSMKVRICFKLNGNEMTTEYSFSDAMLDAFSCHEAIAKTLFKKVSEEIAAKFFENMGAEISKQLFKRR